MEQSGEMNATRRTVAGHTGDTEPLPFLGTPPEVDGRMVHVRADTAKVLKWAQPNLYIGGMEVMELVERLEATTKVLTDMAEALREMERTRRSR